MHSCLGLSPLLMTASDSNHFTFKGGFMKTSCFLKQIAHSKFASDQLKVKYTAK